MTRPHRKSGPVLVLCANGTIGDILGGAPGASLVRASDIAETYQVDLCPELMLLRDLPWDGYEEQDQFPCDLIINRTGVHRSVVFQLRADNGLHAIPLPGPRAKGDKNETHRYK